MAPTDVGGYRNLDRLPSCSHALHELRRGDVERLGQPDDVLDAGIAHAALDVADVGAVQVGLLRQGLLRQPSGLTSFADVLAEGREDRITLWHGQ